MINQLASATVAAGEALIFGDERRQVPEQLLITLVWVVESRGADL